MATHWKPDIEILRVLIIFLTSGDLKPSKSRFIFNYFNQLMCIAMNSL